MAYNCTRNISGSVDVTERFSCNNNGGAIGTGADNRPKERMLWD